MQVQDVVKEIVRSEMRQGHVFNFEVTMIEILTFPTPDNFKIKLCSGWQSRHAHRPDLRRRAVVCQRARPLLPNTGEIILRWFYTYETNFVNGIPIFFTGRDSPSR